MARVRLALILTAAMAVTVACGQDDAGLLVDPGFEEGGEGWAVGGEAAIMTDAAIAHSGQRCAKTRFEDGIAQRVAVEGGSAFEISGWIRRVDPAGVETPKIKVYFYDPAGNEVDVQASEFPDASGEWSRWETVIQAPFNATELNLTLRGFYTGSEWFYWDDLAMRQVDAPDWPRWDDPPNLDGMTVTIPDINDVWTDALLRWPPNAVIPFDGRLDTSVLLSGDDLRVELQRPIEANWALIHTMRPGMNLGNAMLMGRGPGVPPGFTPIAHSEPKEELVTSLQFDGRLLQEAWLAIGAGEVYLNEIQLFGIRGGNQLPGESVELRLSEGAPEGVADDLAAAFAAEGQRAALTAGGAGGGEYALPAGRYTSVFAAPVEGAFGLSGLTLDLALPGASEGDMIEVCLKRPEELDINVRWTTATDRGVDTSETPRHYSDLCRVVSRVEGGRLTTSLDVPDLIYPAGEPLWLTLRTRRDMTLDLAASRVTPVVTPPEDALAEYVPQLERVVRRMYADATEAHVYDSRDWSEMVIGRYVQRLLALDADNGPGTHIYHRIARVKPQVTIERPGPADAPDWAVWAREAMRRRYEILTWWLDNRQQANGELGGHINDDGEYSCNWPSMYLMTGDERIAEALRKLAEVAWEMSGGTGYTVGSRDVEHAAEDQSCTQPQVLVTDYGNPIAVERFMVMSSYFDLWTHINGAGRRQFRSYMFNTKQVWDEPPFDVDQPYCPLSMVGTGHLVWYNRSPQISRIFLEEAESWALACLSTDNGKPAGRIPKEIDANTSEIDPYAPYPNNPVLQQRNSLYRNGAGAYIVQYFMRGAYALTVEDPWAGLMDLWEPSDEEIIERAQANLDRFGDPDARWQPAQDETSMWRAWRLTGDKSWLVEELKECVRQQERNHWLLTEAEPYTDRIPVPGQALLSNLFLGDWTSGKSHVPGHWVSWEGGGLEYAAAVRDASPDHLKALVYSFHEQATPMTMRVWRPPHGRYDVSVGIDRDGDDVADEALLQEDMELWRYDGAVQFDARPGDTLVIELTLLEELDDVRERPDLAIGDGDASMADGALTVTVHNIGGAASPATTLQVLAADGSVLASADIPALGPPDDLQPKTATVRIDLPAGAAPATLVLDPEGGIDEITEANNKQAFGE